MIAHLEKDLWLLLKDNKYTGLEWNILIVELTNEARKKLDSILEKKDPKELLEKRLRIYVSGSGWGGTTLGLVLEEPKEEDFQLDVDSYKFAIGDGLDALYEKFMVEFMDTKYSKRFIVLARQNIDDKW